MSTSRFTIIKKQFVKDNDGYVSPRIVVNDTPLCKIQTITTGVVKIKGVLGNLVIKGSGRKPHLVIYEMKITDSSGSIRAVWFNMPSLEFISRAKEYIFLGKVTSDSMGKLTIMSPTFSTTDDVKKWQAKLDKLLTK